jgi:5'-nucleotidase
VQVVKASGGGADDLNGEGFADWNSEMKKSCWASAVLFAVLVGHSSLAAAGKSVIKAPISLSLIALNDFHGSIMPPSGSVLVPDRANPAGTRVSAGGAAYLSTLVHQLKQSNPTNTLVLATGDMVGASQLTSSLFHDEPTIDILNQIGLDISSVGNHEFDKGREELLRLQKGGCFAKSADGTAGIVGKDTCMNQGRFAGAKFQYLAANVIDQVSGNTLLPAYAIRTLGGVKVGFIGLTLKDTPTVVTPAGVKGLNFADEVETVNTLVPVLQAKGVTVLVVLIHQGGQTSAKTVMDKSCPGFAGEIVALSDRFDPAVDLVISGHTHQEYVCFRPDGKLITQTGAYGRLVTKIDLTVDSQTKKVIAKDANNKLVVNDLGVKDASGHVIALPAGYVSLARDPVVDKVVRRYGDLSSTIADVVVGRLAAPLDRKLSPGGESTLGAVIADAFLAGTSSTAYGGQPAQIAFTNGGGIRSDLSTSLTVSFGQLYSVMPFNNNLVSMDLTGQELLRLLEQQWESPQPKGGRIMPVSNGFSYTWDAGQAEGAAPGKGQRVLVASMKLNGEPIDMDRSYRITVNNFMASGGDNYTVLRQGRNRQDGDIDSVVAKLYFRVKGLVIPPTLDRISVLQAATP